MPGPTPDGREPHGSASYGSASHGSVPHGSASHGSVPHGSASHGSVPHGSASHGSDRRARRQQAPSSCQGPQSEAAGASFWVHHLAFQLCLLYETSLPAV